MALQQWQFWIDRGGTFTDVIGQSPDGRLHVAKWLSDNPSAYPDAALHGIRACLGLSADAPIPATRVSEVRMGTTVATNALLQHRGEPTLFVTTKGFADTLRIRYQNRPHLFDREIQLPAPLYEQVIEADERIAATGQVLRPLDEAALTEQLARIFATGIRACAICLLHGYRYPQHEASIARIAREIGFIQISPSHLVSPLMKLVSRADTTVVDAYLSPVLRRYIARVSAALETGDQKTRLLFMQSSGGLAAADHFAGKDAVLSGPAGGVVGMAAAGQRAGFERLIGFDMGGTSTDVCHFAGRLERTQRAQVAGVHLSAPMMQIHTVAAGGGSVLRYADGRMQVGPSSAGADPGPACYRNGGPLTVTDANLLVGKLQPRSLPAMFGPRGDEPIDAAIVAELFTPIAKATGLSPAAAADGFLRVAVENMARAIKKVSVEKGYDVSRYTLVSFGGAAGQHACAVADALGVRRICIDPLAGVLSAYGIGQADIRVTRQQMREEELSAQLLHRLQADFERVQQQAEADVLAQGIAADAIECERRVFIKYADTDTPLELSFTSSLADLQQGFAAAHAREFGYVQADRPLIVESLLVEAIGKTRHAAAPSPPAEHGQGEPPRSSRFFTGGRWRDCLVYDWAHLRTGDAVDGPAIVLEPHSTIVIEPGWQASMTRRRGLALERTAPVDRRADRVKAVDPVRLEIFNNLFMSIAEQMGVTLEKTAATINIKERLDFSCGLFDAGGGLVANAPHMPVHLGSMSTSVRTAIQRNPDMQRGDMFVLNDPYNGGTHLPDITVIAPVHLTATGPPDFFVAARGHHADVGGSAPGSMPADSTDVTEEGVLIDNFLLIRQGRFDEAGMRALLTSGRYPARNPDRNIADLKAQVAACKRGLHQIEAMVGDFGLDVVNAYMGHVQHNAAESVRRVVDRLRDSQFSNSTDQGTRIAVAIKVDLEQRRASVDFSGTSPQQASNFNAPAAVTRAAVLYVLRCMVDSDIPLNEGCLDPIEIVIPEGCMLAPRYPAATVAGNVETSQVIADVLFSALGAVASAQGTMNNLTCGNSDYQYYETICGGAGAGPGFHGASGVHTHMTNSRMTDPEVLEWRFPLRVEAFALRRGSGGNGQWRGGDGVTRRLRFLAPATLSILSDHRRTPPHGLLGGEPGACGNNVVLRADGEVEALSGCDSREMAVDDVIVIETPGGGGYGQAGLGADAGPET